MRIPLAAIAVLLAAPAVATAQMQDQASAEAQTSDIATLPVAHGVSAPPVDLDAPADLNLSQLRLTFEDRFNPLDVSADGGRGRWFAPVHAPFGTALFIPPTKEGPFLAGPDGMTVRASKWRDGNWRSGTMQTVDSKGRGFAQQYGYFELRGKMPSGNATWASFWLLSRNGYTDTTKTRAEIDVFENYGGDVDRMHSTVHLWPAKRADGSASFPKHWYASSRIRTRGMQTGFHDYGVLVDPQNTTFYFDHHAVLRRPTLPEHRTPLYMLVTLAMNDKDLAKTPSPQDMQVQYVRAYALPGYARAPGPQDPQQPPGPPRRFRAKRGWWGGPQDMPPPPPPPQGW